MKEIVISKSSLFLRLFLWAWEVNSENLNGCKLFWGTLFMPTAFMGKISWVGSAYTSLAIVFYMLKWKAGVIIFGPIGILLFLFEFILKMRKKPEQVKKEKDEKLTKITEMCQDEIEIPLWLEKTLTFIFDIFFWFQATKAGEVAENFLDFSYNSYKKAKTYCPIVRIV